MKAGRIRLGNWTVALLLVAGACNRQPQVPVVESMEPNSAVQGESLTVTIHGKFYLDAHVSERDAARSRLGTIFSASLGSAPLEEIEYVDFERLTARVPTTLELGLQDLRVEDPAGRAGILAGAFTLIPQEVHVSVEDAADGVGTEIGDVSLRVGQMLPVYAVSRTADGTFVETTEAAWSVRGDIGDIDTAVGQQAVFEATTVGSGNIVAESDAYGTDESGVIAVEACTENSQCADPCRSAGTCVDSGCVLGAVDKDTDGDGLLDGLCPGGSDCDDDNPDCTTDCSDADGDGYCLPVDCDDTADTGAGCHVGCSTYYQDADGDLYGDPLTPLTACKSPADYVANNTDCADAPTSDVHCNGLDGAFCNPGMTGLDVCDGADNDCDVETDEDHVPVPTGCGVGACASTGATSCPAGSVVDSCTSGVPAADDLTCDNVDDDCNGTPDDGYVSVPTSCGVGACASTGATSCPAGSVVDSCTPGAPVPENTVQGNCDDTIDNDCDGPADGADPGCSSNTEPVAEFTVTPGGGLVSTSFDFDATSSWDMEDLDTALIFSWDWESDGTYDDVDTGTTTSHVFSVAGLKTITLKVEDSVGRVDYFVGSVSVAAAADMIVVDTNADSSVGGFTTLREAIDQANTDLGPNTIIFTGPMTITMSSDLPAVTDDGTVIAGQPGVVVQASGNTGVCMELSSDQNSLIWIEITGCLGFDTLLVSGNFNYVASTSIYLPTWSNNNAIGVTGSNNQIGPANRLFGATSDGIELGGTNNVVSGNRIYDNDIGIHVTGDSSTIWGNVIFGNANEGVIFGNGVAGANIWHNTVDANGRHGVDVVRTALLDIQGNIFSFNGTSASSSGIHAQAQAEFIILDYNDYYGNTNTGTPCDGYTLGANSRQVDPSYLDAAADDYRLAGSSQCIDAGSDIGLDLNGAEFNNYNGFAPDLGAWEAP